jgi:cytochrome c551/c552
MFRFVLSFLVIVIIAHQSMSQTEKTRPGEIDYQINCMACHQIDTPTVGPSLVQIARNYPKNRLSGFIAWAQNPKKKDPSLIEMPSMLHIPESDLEKIHSYMLKVTEGVVEKKRLYPQFVEPKRSLPYVVSAFLPNTSPASVAVILEGDISLCWDTEACCFRYAWIGSSTSLKGFREPANLPDPFYVENAERLWSFGQDRPQFLGYRLIDGYPELRYSFGDVEVREKIENGPSPLSFTRHFSIYGAKEVVSINLTHAGNVEIVTSKGEQKGSSFQLEASQPLSFAVTISKR